jgi:S1-C subfamily serine protease
MSAPADESQARAPPAAGGSGAAASGSAPATHAARENQAAPSAGRRIIRQAFALVDQVSEDSPASAAGIRAGDEFLVVGAISVRALGSYVTSPASFRNENHLVSRSTPVASMLY